VQRLDTTCEGVWIIQAICGIEVLPATLLLRPWVSEGGIPYGHPGLAALRAAGVLLEDETVHPTVEGWIETLAAADIELCVSVRRGEEHLRAVIARRGQDHAVAMRCGDNVTIYGIQVGDIGALAARMLPLCGPNTPPAPVDPIRLRSDMLLDGLADMIRGDKRPFKRLGLSAQQREIMMMATNHPPMETSFAVIVHDETGDHVGLVAAAITDTEQGRVVAGPVRSQDGTWFTQIVPGTPGAAARAVAAVVSSMGVTWHEHARHK